MSKTTLLKISVSLIFLLFLVMPVLSLPETYYPVTQWNSPVLGQPQHASGPDGIAINHSGMLFVTMYNNTYLPPQQYIVLESFNQGGTFLKSWKSQTGSYIPPYIGRPVAVNSSDCVHFSNGTAIFRLCYLQNGNQPYMSSLPLSQWGMKAAAIDIDSQDNIYIASDNLHCLFRLNRNGQLINQWGYNSINTPKGIAVDPTTGNIWVTNQTYPYYGVVRYNQALQPTAFFSSFGSGTDQVFVNRPAGISVDNQGKIYVVNSGNHEILKIDTNGNLLARMGSFGTNNALGQMNLSEWSDVTVDSNYCVYVTDTYNHKVQKFCPSVATELPPNNTCCCCPENQSNGNLSLNFSIHSDITTSFWLSAWTLTAAAGIGGGLYYLLRRKKE